jgi:hydrogenase expression/formation protein HypD
MKTARAWLDEIRRLPLLDNVRVMNVCGGHERTMSMAGLRRALPRNIELIAGPGCPVCVCPEEDIHAAIELAMQPHVTLVAFGDMLRVPANSPRSAPRTLEEARAAGGDVRPIASPQEVLRIAAQSPHSQVVFFAAGFETTMAPVAGLVAEGVPENLSLLLSGRLTWPAVAMLLESEAPGFDGLIAPGHVSTVMGPEEWAFVPERHNLPTAIGGFTADSLLAALYSVLRQTIENRVFLDNSYATVVRAGGNRTARLLLETTMDVVDAPWRGIGTITRSGFQLKEGLRAIDARHRFPIEVDKSRKRAGQMPPGCDCARVVLGKIRPSQCRLYGAACTPRDPVGPCMVSDEGACRIWWSSGVREREPAAPAASDAGGA